MKILKITQQEEEIIVTVEGYPHAQPVFPSNLTEEELQIKVDAWAVLQSEVDLINNGTATQEVIDKHKPSPERLFDSEVAVGREAQVFTADRLVALAPFSYTINEFLKWKNFAQLKGFLDVLIAQGVAIQADYDNFAMILAEQNIVL